jgi:hypothetical protein
MRALIIAGAASAILALTGCGTAASFTQAPDPTGASCTVEVTNPNTYPPGLYTDLQFSGRGADYQCSGTLQMVPQQGGVAARIGAPHGDVACTTSVGGLTVTEYTNDPHVAQDGCAWMKKRTQQLGG